MSLVSADYSLQTYDFCWKVDATYWESFFLFFKVILAGNHSLQEESGAVIFEMVATQIFAAIGMCTVNLCTWHIE